MCGRYTTAHSKDELLERFDAEEAPGSSADGQVTRDGSVDATGESDEKRQHSNELRPNYNVAPTHLVPIIVSSEDNKVRHLQVVKWGLIPAWVKDIKKQKPLINARAESLAEKPSFKSSLKRRRCIIPADGFYEWKTIAGKKTPMYITATDGQILGFAGIYDDYRTAEGEILRTCSIITTQANNFMSSIHDRMPVILTKNSEREWLDKSVDDVSILCSHLKPASESFLKAHPVSNKVNSVAYNQPECTEEFEQQTLLSSLQLNGD